MTLNSHVGWKEGKVGKWKEGLGEGRARKARLSTFIILKAFQSLGFNFYSSAFEERASRDVQLNIK